MTALRQFFAASVLALTFTISASAGEITTGVASPPPSATTTEGDMHTGVTGDMHTTSTEAAGESVTDAAVALIASVLSLF